jgi:adenylate cyclase
MNAATGPSCRLTYVKNGRREQIALEGVRVVIGRSSSCDVALPDESVSRHHAEFLRSPEGWTIRDLESRNGIEVNGARVSQRLLKDGDLLKIGSIALQCEIRPPVAPPPRVVIDESAHGRPAAHAMIEMDTILPMLRGDEAAAKAAAARRGPAALEESTGLRARLGIAAPLREAAEALLSATDLDTVLDGFLKIVGDHLHAQRGFIGLLDAGGTLATRATWSAKAKEGAAPIVISRAIADSAIHEHRSILVVDAPGDERFRESESIVKMQIRSAMCAPFLREGKVVGLIYVDTASLAEPFRRDHLEVLSVLATLAAVAIEETQLRATVAREQRMRDRLARYSSASVVDHIVGGHGAAEPGVDESGMSSREREITVLFCDFAGFTTFAEKLPPAVVTQVLNRAFERLTAAVFAEEGTLDKFTGDGMMVFFGAPIDQPDHALRAVRTAVRMQRALAEPVPEGETMPPLALRIGINSGPAIVGDIGTPARRDYTAIGATVNTASRLESSVARPGQVVIGPGTYEAVKDSFHCVPLTETLLRGMTRPLQPYLVLGEPEPVKPADGAAPSTPPPTPAPR